MFNTPILFIIFNRPDTTQKVFEQIRAIKPKKLFIAADGPRKDRVGELEKCLEVRKIVSRIDWPCELRTFFSHENLGPFWGPVKAITWFFTEVEEGIILEDDCLPDSSFFTFCEKMLNYYRDVPQVMHISGSNLQFGQKFGEKDYYFSKYTHVWGWATWKRAWQHYFDIEKICGFELPELESFLVKISRNKKEATFWIRKFSAIHQRKRNGIWDYQWNFTVWYMNGLAVVPNANLISNIGFREDATGTTNAENKFANIPSTHFTLETYATIIKKNEQADFNVFDRSGYYFHPTITDKIRWKLKLWIS